MKRTPRLPHWPPRLPGAWGGWLRSPLLPKVLLGVLTAAILTALVFTHLNAAYLHPRQLVFTEGVRSRATAELNTIFATLKRAASPLLPETDVPEPRDLPPDIVDMASQLPPNAVAQLHLKARFVLDEVTQGTGLTKPQLNARIIELANVHEQNPDRARLISWVLQYTLNQSTLRTESGLAPSFVRLLAVAILMFFGVFALGIYLRFFARPVYERDLRLVLLASLLVVMSWASMTLGHEAKHEYLVALIAVPSGAMAIGGLLGVPVAIVSTILAGAIAGMTGWHPFPLMLLTLASALAGVIAISAVWPATRSTIPAVLALMTTNFLLLISLHWLQTGESLPIGWTTLPEQVWWAVIGTCGAIFIAIGAIYILARPFGITTHFRLMELSNPNEPLLRRLMLEAPGTYHSSVMVANMAEAAADAIGANALLTRVAALYHDIGKLKRPAFFVENQAPLGIDNVHQRLSPRLSYLILTSHVRDGAEMARTYRLPEEMVAIIREHHGTTLAAYFYHRALNDARSGQVSEHDFRYPGPKPSTREAAVVMLSDSVQASVKAIKDPTPSRIEHMVQEIINNRLEDGQLEDCDLTLRDLRRISEVFIRILSGLYTYTRIEYPDIKGEGTRNRGNAHPETASAPRESAATSPSN